MKWKRILIALTVTVLMASAIKVPVSATAPTDAASAEAGAAEIAEETPEQKAEREAAEMPIETNQLKGWPQGPATRGEAAIIMEVGTGAILYAKNIDAKEYPASITKVLTALVALEHGNLTDNVTFSNDCVSFIQPGDSSVGLKEGNTITLEQALYATLLASANEAAYAVAANVGKNAGHDYDWFIQQMNEKCKELGGRDSNFTNANGLHDANHYTSARDMALIGRELFNYPDFFRIVQTLNYKIDATDVCEEHVFQQKHKMLIPGNANYYEYVVGGKTGFTSDALSTLITMADNGDTKLVCVVLRTHGTNVYPDTRGLFEYGFNNFTKVSVKDNEKSKDVEEIAESDTDGYVMLPKGLDFDDLDMKMTVEKGRIKEALLTYSYDGYILGTAKAKPSKAYISDHAPKIKAIPESKADKKESTTKRITTVAVLAAGVVAAAVVFYMRFVSGKRKRGRHHHNRNR